MAHHGRRDGSLRRSPPDGQWVVQATFSEPGAYVLRCQAHDGALATNRDVTVTVTR